jgi:hypothetical protein
MTMPPNEDDEEQEDCGIEELYPEAQTEAEE